MLFDLNLQTFFSYMLSDDVYQTRTEYVNYLEDVTSLQRLQFLLWSTDILLMFPYYSVLTRMLFAFASHSDTIFLLFAACVRIHRSG